MTVMVVVMVKLLTIQGWLYNFNIYLLIMINFVCITAHLRVRNLSQRGSIHRILISTRCIQYVDVMFSLYQVTRNVCFIWNCL